MKKLLFVAALGVAGLMSAKGNTNQVKEEKMPKKNVKNKNASNLQVEAGCFPFTLSCGVQGTACGDNTAELLLLIWDADNAICGK